MIAFEPLLYLQYDVAYHVCAIKPDLMGPNSAIQI